MKKLFFLLLTAVCAMLYAPPIHAWTVYLDPANVGDNPQIYLYGGGYGNMDWGKRTTMSKNDDGRWYYTSAMAVTGFGKAESVTPASIIFLKRDGKTQSKGDGALSFSDGKTYTWDGTGASTPTSATWNEYTVYFDASVPGWANLYFNATSPSKISPVELKTYHNSADMPKAKGELVKDDIFKFKFAAASNPTGNFYLGTHSGWNNEQTMSISDIQDGYIYKATSQRTETDGNHDKWYVESSVYNPLVVSKVELVKDGTTFRSATATYGADGKLAPVVFSLSSLTGTGVYTIDVTCSDGTTETVTKYFATHPTDDGSPLAVADRDNTFQLNPRNSSTIIASADMTINFDGTTATDYTLANVKHLSHVAKVSIVDYADKEAGVLTHRQDGKYVLEGFTPASTGTAYFIKVELPDNNDTGYKTAYYSITGNLTIVDHIRDAVEVPRGDMSSTTGFKFENTHPTNVSVRLERGIAKKISLGDNNGFYTIYFRKPFADWAPYVRLSSSETQGYWWRRMASVNGRPDLYSISFDPHLYDRVRFFSDDYFDLPESQTERVEAVNQKLYTVAGTDVVTTGEPDKIGRPLNRSTQDFEIYTVTSVNLTDGDCTKISEMTQDALGNWTVNLTAPLPEGTTYLIEVNHTPYGENQDETNYFTVTDGSITAAAAGSTPMKPTGDPDVPFTINLNGATEARLSVAMDDKGCEPVSASLIDPNAGIKSIKMVRRDGEQTYVFAPTDDGMTWTWEGIGIKAHDSAGSTDAKSYQIEVVNSGETQKWYFQNDDYGFSKGSTYSNDWKQADGTQRFRFTGGDNLYKNETMIVITLTDDKLGIKSLRVADAARSTSPNIYMPLTEEDFKSGPRYFLVGSRTADWRLQPEWELKPDGNGNVTLSGRLMYQQLFGIAKVDNWGNYTTHQYTLYAANYDVKEGYCTNISLSNKGRAEGIRYDKTSGEPHPYNDRLRWKVDKTGWDADTWTQTTPTYLNKVTVTLTGEGNPDKLSFDYSRDDAKIAKARTFSLTGENIRYQGEFTFSDGRPRNLAMMTPGSHLTRNWDDNSDRWGNAWVQTDKNGRPYVDGNGDLLYNTAFDSEWLSKHTVRFYNQAQDLEYTSLNTTFVLAENLDLSKEPEEFKALYKMHPESNGKGYNRIGNGETRQYTENETTLKYKESFHDDFKAGREYIDRSDWQCYVVKDMWLDGEFKIWTGWGGNMKKYNNVNDGAFETAEQWFFENAGHQDTNTDKVVRGFDVTQEDADITVYPTRRDQQQANFRIDGMTYYSRVILWYNPQQGCENSVLQLVRATYGPNIQAFHNLDTRNTLRYEWWISFKKEDLAAYKDVEIDTYTVKRYRLDGNNAVYDATIEENSTAQQGTKIGDMYDDKGNVIKKIAFKDDKNTIDPGQYQYGIEVWFKDAATPKTAMSNVVTINETSIPVQLTARQDVDPQSRYEFAVTLNMRPTQAALNMPVGDTGKKVKDMMKYYVLVVGEPTAKRLNNDASYKLKEGDETPVKFVQATADDPVLIADGTALPAGTWYYKHEITDKDNPAVLLQWAETPPNASGRGGSLKKWEQAYDENTQPLYWYDDFDQMRSLYKLADQEPDYVAPYTFRAFLVSDDSDIREWAQLNFDMAAANTDVIAPATDIDFSTINLRQGEIPEDRAPYNMRYDENNERILHLRENFQADEFGWPNYRNSLSGTVLRNLQRRIEWKSDNGNSYLGAGEPDYKMVGQNLVHYRRINELAAEATIDPLPVGQSVQNSGVDYNIIVVPKGTKMTTQEVTADQRYNVPILHDIESAFDPKAEYSLTLTDINLADIPATTSIDGSHSNAIDVTTMGEKNYAGNIFVTYHLKSKTTGKDMTYVNTDGKPVTATFNPAIKAPKATSGEIRYKRYHERFYHPADDENGNSTCWCGKHHDKPYTDDLGYFAHAVVDFSLTDIDTDSKAAYIGFHAQQKVMLRENGCYSAPCYAEKVPDWNEYNSTDMNKDEWCRYSFVDTRAANGGAPATQWIADSGIEPLSDMDGTLYEEVTAEQINLWTWNGAKNDWSTMAVNTRRLPLHINPVHKYADENDEVFDPAELNATFAAVYPTIVAYKMSVTNMKAKTQSTPQNGPARASSDDGVISTRPKYDTNDYTLTMFTAPTTTPVEWSKAKVMTGVEDIMGDGDDNASAEYYNLQGMRVMNPAKGQIYIVRRGSKVSKVLYK